MKTKLTKQEKNWILYDVGNSAFTLLAATILPIYFNYIAGKQGLSDVQYLAYWGYAVSIATLLTALAGPVFGTVADTKGYKKPVFTIALGIGTIASVALGFAKYWLAFLVVFVIAKVGYSVTLVFYDSMLVTKFLRSSTLHHWMRHAVQFRYRLLLLNRKVILLYSRGCLEAM